MLLSVVIPTYKRLDALASCLELVAPAVQNLPAECFEVIVTDDESGGKTAEYIAAKFPWARHVAGPQQGPACNRNNGARAAQGEWLLFLDDDCLPQPGFLAAYAAAIKAHPEYRVFEGRTLADRPQHRLDEEAPVNDKGGYLWSCNFVINRQTFFDIGGFCEIYPYACMEDVDFREQLKSNGHAFLFVPEACVIHPWRSLTPEDKYLKMCVVSHDLFYQRYPAQRLSRFQALRIILRIWVLFLFLEAPRFGFRGFWRYYERQVTTTRYLWETSQGAKAA